MKILELFSGNGDISKAFSKVGFKTFKVDWSKDVDADLHVDVSSITVQDVLKLCGGVPDVIWASPQCTTYSIATHKHRTKKEGLIPKTETAKQDDEVNIKMWKLIEELLALGTRYYFVENPRGRMRLMDFVKDKPRFTISYCSYGRDVMKPTDIWTNHPNPNFIPLCKIKDGHHKKSDDATSSYNKVGKDRYLLRGKMPEKLCNYIANICV
jgi:hypothetical protein